MKLFSKKITNILLITILVAFIEIVGVGASCKDYDNESDCKRSNDYACVWNKHELRSYCNTDNLTYVKCGDAYDIPSQAPALISFAVNLLKIATPIVLIIVGIITLVKAVAATKEDEIKKAQNSLIKKVIASVMVFFVVSVVQFVILRVADKTEHGSISSCMSCFLNNECSKNIYYKTAIGSKYKCTYLKDNTSFNCK